MRDHFFAPAVVAVFLFVPAARAAEPPEERRRSISIDAAFGARFEERSRDGDWVLLCTGTCDALAIVEPSVRHRVRLGEETVDLPITDVGPVHFRVVFPAFLPRIGAAAVTGIGAATASVGVFFLAAQAIRPESAERPRRPGEIDLRDTGLVLLGLGAVAAVVGGLWMLQSFRRPRVEQTASPTRLDMKLFPAPPRPREKTWAAADLPIPPPPATIIPILGGTFL